MKMKKSVFNIMLTFIPALGIMYVLFSFVLNEWSPSLWMEKERAAMVVVSFLLSAAIEIIHQSNKR